MATTNDGPANGRKRNRGTNRGPKRTKNLVERTERMERALKLRLEERSFRQIAQELGCSVSTAKILVDDALAELFPVEEASQLRDLKLEQLKNLIQHWLPYAFGQERINVLVKQRDPETGIETVDTVAVLPTFASMRDATHTVGKLMELVHKFAGMDQLDESGDKKDPAEMGLSSVDQELYELLESARRVDQKAAGL